VSTDLHKVRLVMELRRGGITDTTVLSAMERIPREKFIPLAMRDRAYENTALPIAFDQTISQPLVVARMAMALELDDRCKVLEIGTGSGYNAAVLSRLCRRVYTMERYRPMVVEAEERFAKLGLHNITVILGDGMLGWPPQQPFDRISVTAAGSEPPQALIDQLADGGIMVMPVGDRHKVQTLVRFRKSKSGIAEEALEEVRFVPLVSGIAEEAEAS
jgi:protein-L-isoaspartate(D-aspartate) O-methyltransferase